MELDPQFASNGTAHSNSFPSNYRHVSLVLSSIFHHCGAYTTGFFYLYYSRSTTAGPNGATGNTPRISRFKHVTNNGGISASPSSEMVIWIDNSGYPDVQDEYNYDHVRKPFLLYLCLTCNT